MKKLNFKKILSLLTVFTLSLGILCFGGCNTVKEDSETSGFKDFNLSIKDFTENGIKLSRTASTLVEDDEGNYLVERVIANVSGDDDLETGLLWSIDWQDEAVTVDINEYLQLEVSTEAGNRYCDVKCFKNFEDYGSAILTVVSTSDNTITSGCVVEYIGAPTYSLLDSEGTNLFLESEYILTQSESYSFDLDVFHPLGLGKNFLYNYDISFRLDGDVTIRSKYDTYFGSSDIPFDGVDTSTSFDMNCEEYNALFDFEIWHLPVAYQNYSFEYVDKLVFSEDGSSFLPINMRSIFDYNSYISYEISGNCEIAITCKILPGIGDVCQVSTPDDASVPMSWVYEYDLVSAADLTIVMEVRTKEFNILVGQVNFKIGE